MQNSQALNLKEMETIVGGYGQGDCLATIAGTAATGVKGGATAGAIATTGPFAGVGALAGAVSGGNLGYYCWWFSMPSWVCIRRRIIL